MATCPTCGVRREGFTLEPRFEAVGPAYIAGVQTKVSARMFYILEHTCGYRAKTVYNANDDCLDLVEVLAVGVVP